jgi:hypothetical protein
VEVNLKVIKLRQIFISIILLLASPLGFSSTDAFYNFGEYMELVPNIDGNKPNRPEGIPFTRGLSKYGKLIIQEGVFSVIAKKIPWSGWWYPIHDRRLFEGNEEISTLERFDQYIMKNNPQAESSRDYEENEIYEPQSGGWAGLCHAWALASIMEDEPKNEVVKKGIKFRIEDLKGLLIKTYEKSYPTETFGQRNNADWDSVYEDIYPEEFHTVLKNELFEKRTPFLMDFDPGFQVWNVPVYKAKIIVKKDLNNENIVQVKTVVTTASPYIEDINFVGTSTLTFIYMYDFYGHWDDGGNFHVDYGLWVKRGHTDSRKRHPDFLIIRPKSVERKSANKFITPMVVDEILKGSH